MTVPDPHVPTDAPLTRRALRARREQAVTDHPPIFKAPPPPLQHVPAISYTPMTPPLLARSAPTTSPRHARRPRPTVGARVAVAAASALVIVSGSATAALAVSTAAPVPARTVAAAPAQAAAGAGIDVTVSGVAADGTVVDSSSAWQAVESAAVELCTTPSFVAALDAHDDVAAIRAAGGGERFRAAVVNGQAPCVTLDDPTRLWAVVNKRLPLVPRDYAPAPLKAPDSVPGGYALQLRADVADALTRMAADAQAAGAGQIGLASGYRSLATQVSTYSYYVRTEGQAQADRSSARPGFSEHQTGLAADVVACATSCGALDGLAASAQGAWLADHSWEYGWIVRYEDGRAPVTGYMAEPWHLRYVGVDLAAAYRAGGFHTLEDFFALPAAPDYAG